MFIYVEAVTLFLMYMNLGWKRQQFLWLGSLMMYYIESEMPMILKTQAHGLPVCVCVYTALLD